MFTVVLSLIDLNTELSTGAERRCDRRLLKLNRQPCTTVNERSKIVRSDVEAYDVTGSGSSRRRGRDETTGIRNRRGVRVAVFNPSVEQSQAGIAKRRPSKPATIGDAAIAGRVECGVRTRTIGYALLN